jgi:guanine deaminase
LSKRAFRASILHFLSDPGCPSDSARFGYFPDGLLLTDDGLVTAVGDASDLLPGLGSDRQLTDYSGKLILPGFVDCHVHYPQLDIIASHGEQLLQWLERYAFPAEMRFADPAHAADAAAFFLDELLRNGTTTALVLATVHPQSVDAFFSAAAARRLRMIAGKALMDRHAPAALTDTPERGYADSKALIRRWAGVGRLDYAITPRYAPTSSAEQLARAGQLAREVPEAYVHTHVSENREELAWVARLFPEHPSYLDVYAHYGLLGERTILAHCLHLTDAERRRIAAAGAATAFCPTSNLFLGSGLFDLAASDRAGVHVGLATDVGAGTSLSMLRTLHAAYQVLQLRGQALCPLRAFYLATRGGARALRLEHRIGSFAPGNEADFVVLDPRATALMARRMAAARQLEERLFVWLTLGDDRAVAATHVLGEPLYRR